MGIIRYFMPSNILVAGESAGGNLSLALCFKLQQMNLVDLSDKVSDADWQKTKDFLHPTKVNDFAKAYASDADHENPLVSPLFGQDEQLAALPPVFLTYGS